MGARQRELGRAHFLRRLLHMLVHSAAFQRRDAGAALFQDLVVLEHLQEGVDLVRLADQFKHHAVRRQVNDLGLVNVGDLPQLGAVVHVGRHLEQQQFPLEGLVLVQHEHLPGHFHCPICVSLLRPE